jgi:hypothetical protein
MSFTPQAVTNLTTNALQERSARCWQTSDSAGVANPIRLPPRGLRGAETADFELIFVEELESFFLQCVTEPIIARLFASLNRWFFLHALR